MLTQMSNYIQDISALIRISEFLDGVAHKDHIEKSKAYAVSRMKFSLDKAIVDLVSDPKFLDFVKEVNEAQTLAQSEQDFKRLMAEHQKDIRENLSTVTLVPADQTLDHVHEVDQALHKEREEEKQHQAEEAKDTEKVEAGKKSPAETPKEPAKKKSAGFRRVKE